MKELLLYELAGKCDIRYSLFAWRTRMALRHKRLPFATRGVRVSDKASIEFSGQELVPILVDGDTITPDSSKIAEYLEDKYADSPTLYGCEKARALGRFVSIWVDRRLVPLLVPLLMIDVVELVDEEDANHLRRQIEGAFGKSLEELSEDRERKLKAFGKEVHPARLLLKSQPFIAGEDPTYSDYVLFSLFQWARIVSNTTVLQKDDSLHEWIERLSDLYDGFARQYAG